MIAKSATPVYLSDVDLSTENILVAMVQTEKSIARDGRRDSPICEMKRRHMKRKIRTVHRRKIPLEKYHKVYRFSFDVVNT